MLTIKVHEGGHFHDPPYVPTVDIVQWLKDDIARLEVDRLFLTIFPAIEEILGTAISQRAITAEEAMEKLEVVSNLYKERRLLAAAGVSNEQLAQAINEILK